MWGNVTIFTQWTDPAQSNTFTLTHIKSLQHENQQFTITPNTEPESVPTYGRYSTLFVLIPWQILPNTFSGHRDPSPVKQLLLLPLVCQVMLRFLLSLLFYLFICLPLSKHPNWTRPDQLIAFPISQNASAGVSRMLLGNKCDIEAKRKVSKETGEKVTRP